jgi:hypothetical protein
MNTRPDIERVLDHWLEDGPRAIPERVVDDALVVVARTDQIRRRRWILPSVGRHPSLQLALIAVLILLVAAVGVAAVAGFLRDPSAVVPLPSVVAPTPRGSSPAVAVPSPSPAVARLSPSPVLRASVPPRPAGANLLLNGNAMVAGQRYTTLSFEPAFTIGGADGWLIPLPAPNAGLLEGRAHAYFFGAQPTTGDPLLIPSLSLIRPSQVITEGGVSTEPAPADIIAWLEARSDLSLGKRFKVQVAGVTGTAVEGTVRKGAAENSVGSINLVCSTDNTSCGWDDGQEVGVGRGQRFRFVVFDVRGQTVLLQLADDEREWAADLPTLEKLMTSLDFPGPTG